MPLSDYILDFKRKKGLLSPPKSGESSASRRPPTGRSPSTYRSSTPQHNRGTRFYQRHPRDDFHRRSQIGRTRRSQSSSHSSSRRRRSRSRSGSRSRSSRYSRTSHSRSHYNRSPSPRRRTRKRSPTPQRSPSPSTKPTKPTLLLGGISAVKFGIDGRPKTGPILRGDTPLSGDEDGGFHMDNRYDGAIEEEKAKNVAQSQHSNIAGSRRFSQFYSVDSKVSEGSYGVVNLVTRISTGKLFACKIFRRARKRSRFDGSVRMGLDATSVREIDFLKTLPPHRNLVKVEEVVVGATDQDVCMIMEYVPHDLYALNHHNRGSLFSGRSHLRGLKDIVQSLLEGVLHLHENGVTHRDIKPKNLLVDQFGTLKICDFGQATSNITPANGSPDTTPQTLTPGNQTTTLHYRAPEMILGARVYDQKVDMWSVGCVLAELILGRVLFHADTEMAQLEEIFKVFGPPSDRTWKSLKKLGVTGRISFSTSKNSVLDVFSRNPNSSRYISSSGLDLLCGMLRVDPSRRFSAKEALAHKWFTDDPSPRPIEPPIDRKSADRNAGFTLFRK